MHCWKTAHHSVATMTENYTLLPFKSLIIFSSGNQQQKREPQLPGNQLFIRREILLSSVHYFRLRSNSSLCQSHQKRWEKGISYTHSPRNRLNPDTSFHDLSVKQVIRGYVKGRWKENMSVKQFYHHHLKLLGSLCDHPWPVRVLSKLVGFSLASLAKAAWVGLISPTKDIPTAMNLENRWHVIRSYGFPHTHSLLLSLCFVCYLVCQWGLFNFFKSHSSYKTQWWSSFWQIFFS